MCRRPPRLVAAVSRSSKLDPVGWACIGCGGDNPEGTRFCGHCGSPRQSEQLIEVGEATFLAQEVAERLVVAGETGMAEERRMVTALFADVSGFTALGNALDPEELVAIIEPVVAHISEIVGRYDGFVGKYAGDAILGFFGAPVAHEDDPLRAVLAAKDMQLELPAILAGLPTAGAHLTLHIGVNTGPVVAGFLGGEVRMDYSVLGDAVNVAQRLEAAAGSGEVYVGVTTYELTRDKVDYEPVGELVLKGKPDPVPVWRLVTGAPTSPVVETVDASDEGTRILGRHRELSDGDRVLDRLSDGDSGVLAIMGEPGVGKTRLAQEVRSRAERRGVTWLQTRCVSYGASLPYWPWAELVRRLTATRVEDAPADTSQALATRLSELGAASAVPFFARLLGLPVTGDHPGAGDTDVATLDPLAFRTGLHAAFAELVRTLAGAGPLIVAIEDAHWLDAPSAALAHDLVAATSDSSVLFVFTGRPEGDELLDGVAAGTTEPQRHRIDVGPLDREGVISMAGALLDGVPPGELIDALQLRTGGNPLFVQEVVRSLCDGGALVRDDSGWRLRSGWNADSVPPTVEKVLAARIDMLPRQSAHVLQVASVIGRHVRRPLLHGVLPEVTDLDETVERLVDSGFLDRVAEDGERSLMFHHALVLDVAYARLLRNRRCELHRRIAEIGEVIYGAGDDNIDLLARHAYLGELGAKAVSYLARAAERAKRLFANDEAILDLSRAAEVARQEPDAEDSLPGLLLDLADLEELTGEFGEAFRTYSEVRTMTADPRACQGMAATLRKQGDYERALEVLADAEQTCAGASSSEAAGLALEKGWALAVSGRTGEAITALQDGLGLVAGTALPVEGQLLLMLARAEEIEDLFTEAAAHGLEAKRLFEHAGDLRNLVIALRVTGGTHLHLNQLPEAEQLLRQGVALADRVGYVEERAGCLLNLGLVLKLAGRIDEAIECDRQTIVACERLGIETGRAAGYCNLADKLIGEGRFDEALEPCLQGLQVSRDIGNVLWTAESVENLARILDGQGRHREAANRAVEAAELFLGIDSPGRARGAFDTAVRACEAVGDMERAQALMAQARSLDADGATL